MHREDRNAPPDVDAILARFPGPVTLYVTRRQKLAMFAGGLAFAALGAWLLLGRHPSRLDLHDTLIAWFGILLGGWIAVSALIVQSAPWTGSLTLDASGF